MLKASAEPQVFHTQMGRGEVDITYTSSYHMETHLHLDPQEIKEFQQGYQKDKHFADVLREISKNQKHNKYPQYSLREDGILLFDTFTGYQRVCVPRTLIFEILKEIHDNVTGVTHAGRQRTYARVSQGFYWPKMKKDIDKFVQTCQICQQIKKPKHAPYGYLQPIPIPEKPFDVVTMDLIVDLPKSNGYDAIFVLVCKLTKYAFFIPCNNTLSEKGAAQLFFDHIVTHIGLPKQVISDRDSRWKNIFWKEVCDYMGSKRSLTTAYHPQADRQTEILNQTLEVAIRAYTNFERNNWSELLPKLAYAYNNTPHTATKHTPAFLLYGFQPRGPLSYLLEEDYIERPTLDQLTQDKAINFIEEFEGARQSVQDALRRAQVTFEKAYNKKHLPVTFQVGEKVLINVQSLRLPNVTEGKGIKFTRRMEGPYEVLEKISDVTYRRIPQDYDIHPVISIAHIEKYHSPPKETGDRVTLPPLRKVNKTTEEFTVTRIVNERKCKERGRLITEYQCEWEGYGVEDTWIPERNLRNAKEVLQEWRTTQKQKSLK